MLGQEQFALECIQLRLPPGFLVVRTPREGLCDRVQALVVCGPPTNGFRASKASQ